MSQTIDKRVVEMQFDNKQFESGVKESLGTLDKLKNILDKGVSSKSIDNIGKAAKNTDMSSLVSGVQALSDRFSTLGIVGMRVIENITDGLMNGLSRGIHAATDAIISGGVKRAMNIENAHFQLQGLINDEREVQAVMDNAMDSVDGTAYAYDEAAKAASMFAASGLKSGNQMETALRGIAGVAATTNQEYQRVADVFTKIAGKGKIQGEELNQFASMGMNAAAAMTKYFNEVNDGTTEVDENFKKLVTDLTGGLEITEADLRDLVSGGEVSFELFSRAMGDSFGEHAKDANKTFTGSMANIRAALARTGAMFISPLVKQDGPFVQFFNAIRIKVNEFNKALGATNGIAAKFTTWINNIVTKMTGIVENFKIANTFVQKFGDGTSKVFESADKSIQKWGDGTEKVVSRKVYTPFHAFQDILYSIVNIFKALGSIIKPIGQAFKDVFSFKEGATGLYQAIEKFRQFTETLKLSEKNSEDLRKAFKGLFSIVKSVLDVIGKFIKALIPGQKSAGSFGDTILEVAGSLGEALTTLSEWIDKSVTLQAIFDAISVASNFMAAAVGKAFGFLSDQLKGFDANDVLTKAADKFNQLGDAIYNAMPDWAKEALENFSQVFSKLGEDIANFDIEAMQTDFENLGKIIENISQNVLHLDQVKQNIIKFFDFNNEESGVNKFKTTLEDFINWFKTTVLPIFDGVSLGGLLAGGGGMYAFIEIGNMLSGLASMFRGAGKTLTEVPKVLQAIRKEIVANQHEINANAILKVSIAIGILCGAIFALAQIDDPKKLIAAAAAVGTIALAMITGLVILEKLPKKMVTVADALKSAGNKLAKALNKSLTIRAVGASVKDLALAIGIIIASVAGIMYLWDKDSEKFKNALSLVGIIAGTLILTVGIMGKLGQVLGDGMKNFGIASAGVLALAVAMLIIIGAVKQIMDMELPNDWESRLKILGALFIGVAGLAVAVGFANMLSGKTGINIGKGGFSSTGGGMKAMPLLAMCALIYTATLALKEVMGLELGKDAEQKLKILQNIFIGLGALIVALGIAGALAKGNLKAGGTIIAMCVAIYAIIGALKILSNFPARKYRKAILELAPILIGMALILVAAGQVNGLGAAASILAMVFLVGAIVSALGILSMISWQGLLKGALSLAGILFALSITFAGIGKINNGNAYKPVLAMCLMVAVIAGSLGFLANKDWAGLLVGALGISAVLLTLSQTFRKISGSSVDPKKMAKKIGNFLLLGLSLAEIAIPLAILAQYPWQNMLAGAASITAVLLAYTKTFETISKAKKISTEQIGNFLLGALATWIIALPLAVLSQMPWDGMLAGAASISAVLLAYTVAFAVLANAPDISLKNVLMFLLGSLSTLVIGLALKMVADLPWQGMLAAAASISAVLLAYTVAFAVLAIAGNSPGLVPGIAAFLAGTLGIIAIGYAINKCASNDWKSLLSAGASISMVVLAMSVAMLLCTAAGALAPAALTGIGLLDIFIADLTAVLMGLGYLKEKVPNFDQLIEGGSGILGKIGKALGDFAGGIIQGISEGVGKSLEAIGKSLSRFMINAQGFFDGLSNITPDMVNAAKSLVGVVLALTVADFLSGIGNMFKVFTGDADPDLLGPKLASFGRSIMEFYNTTKGIKDAEQFNLVAQGALYLIDMCKQIPNSGGWLGKVFGENDADMWGKQVEKLGYHMVTLANTIAGKDFSSFEPFSKAVLTLIDMAQEIPNSGGWLGKVFGENDADMFGKQVSKLGYHMANLVETLTGLSFTNIDPFAQAVITLIDMATKIPNSGGLVSLITGDNDLPSFGKALEKFSTHFKVFIENIAGVDAGQVSLIASSIEKIISVATMMSGVDNNSLSNFGKTLENMAITGLTSFINTFSSQGPQAVQAVQDFVIRINASITGENSTTFQQAFTKLVDNGIKAYRQAITNNTAVAITAVTQLIQKIIQAMTKFDSQFKQRGIAHATNYLTGIKGLYAQAQTTGQALANKVLAGLQSSNSSFTSAGSTSANKYLDGVKGQFSSATSVGANLAQKVIEGFSSKNSEASNAGTKMVNAIKSALWNDDIQKAFNSIGANMAQGLINGLNSKYDDVKKAAEKLAKAAEAATKAAAKVESPSKVFRKIGGYLGEGLVLGIEDWLSNVEHAGEDLGDSAISGMSSVLDTVNDMMDDIDPTITPIVDLTNVMAASDMINQMFSTAMLAASDITARASQSMGLVRSTKESTENIQNESDKSGTNVTFNQYNTSPKALSRLDIYRDTRNQLSQLKEVMNGV